LPIKYIGNNVFSPSLPTAGYIQRMQISISPRHITELIELGFNGTFSTVRLYRAFHITEISGDQCTGWTVAWH